MSTVKQRNECKSVGILVHAGVFFCVFHVCIFRKVWSDLHLVGMFLSWKKGQLLKGQTWNILKRESVISPEPDLRQCFVCVCVIQTYLHACVHVHMCFSADSLREGEGNWMPFLCWQGSKLSKLSEAKSVELSSTLMRSGLLYSVSSHLLDCTGLFWSG